MQGIEEGAQKESEIYCSASLAYGQLIAKNEEGTFGELVACGGKNRIDKAAVKTFTDAHKIRRKDYESAP